MLTGDPIVLTVFLWIIILLFALIFFAFGIQRVIKHYFHYPIPALAARFIDNPLRRRFQPPKQVLDWIDIEEGMFILEIGPGPGTFTFEAAKRTGEQGQLFAIDIQPSIVKRLSGRLRTKGISNVFPLVASAHALPFLNSVFNRVFMVGVLGEIPDKHRTLLEVKRVLNDGGLSAIGELLPDPDYPRRKTVIKWCSDVGLELASSYGGILHYVLAFKKSM
jgi:ubiquinone/menaquinone biosynthesis C-methylase UbiE